MYELLLLFLNVGNVANVELMHMGNSCKCTSDANVILALDRCDAVVSFMDAISGHCLRQKGSNVSITLQSLYMLCKIS